MGEGGCPPAYFMHRMSMPEAVSYMRGQDRRSRQQWEQTRLLVTFLHKVLTGEDYEMSFPWDEESAPSEAMTIDDQREMWAKARAMEELVNRRGGNL